MFVVTRTITFLKLYLGTDTRQHRVRSRRQADNRRDYVSSFDQLERCHINGRDSGRANRANVYFQVGVSLALFFARSFRKLKESFKHRYLGSMPNTYTFTKRLAEQVINDYSKDLPSIIFRPSIGTQRTYDLE